MAQMVWAPAERTLVYDVQGNSRGCGSEPSGGMAHRSASDPRMAATATVPSSHTA